MEEVMDEIEIKKYSDYKDSGVEWIGEIPGHWETSKLASLLDNISERNRTDLPLLSITRERGVILRDLDNEEENHNYIPDDLTNYKVLRKGFFGMNKMKAWQGSYGIAEQDGIVSPAYFVFRLRNDVEPRFFHLAIRSKLYISFFGAASDGVRVGQWDLSKDRMKNIPFLLPPSQEQTSIAQFLDRKTALIDQAIGIKEKQIELLKERRQILIHRAVTRGLNPDVKMKDSGVEWIGEIPEGWNVVKLKFVAEFINDGTHGTYQRIENGYRLLSVRNMVEDEFIFLDDDSMISERDFKAIVSKFEVKEGDVQLAIVGATLGKVAIVKKMTERFVTQRSVATIRLNTDLYLSKMLFYFIKSSCFQAYLWLNAGFSAQPGVYLGTVGDSYVTMMDIEEQNEIVFYLENITKNFEAAIQLKALEIEKLKEYKSSLINSAVTGKIKVC